MSDGVALIRRDDGTSSKLLVGVGRPDNLLLSVVDDGERGEAVAGPKLSAPPAGDGVNATGRSSSRGLASGLALDGKGAGRDSRHVGIDREGPGARSVGGIADTLHADNGPLRSGGSGVNGRSCKSSGSKGCKETGSDLHFGGMYLIRDVESRVEWWKTEIGS